MVSRIPTYPGKTIDQRVSRELVLPILAATFIAAMLLIAYNWQMLALMALHTASLSVSACPSTAASISEEPRTSRCLV